MPIPSSRIPRASALSTTALAILGVAISGCTNISGLGGTSDFQCKAPEGIPCQSVSGVHYNERAGNLPAQRAALGHGAPTTELASAKSYGVASQEASRTQQTGAVEAAPLPALGAIRSDPTVIRIWIAPWEDADGDLNDESRVYLQIDSGRWLIEHNRERIRNEFAPLAVSPAARGQAAPAATPGQRPSGPSTSQRQPSAGLPGSFTPVQEPAR